LEDAAQREQSERAGLEAVILSVDEEAYMLLRFLADL
jgi:hypothetical protein